jgi:hypothetical protein
MVRKVTWSLVATFPISLVVAEAIIRFQPPRDIITEHGRTFVDHWPTPNDIIAGCIALIGALAFIIGSGMAIHQFIARLIDRRHAATRHI